MIEGLDDVDFVIITLHELLHLVEESGFHKDLHGSELASVAITDSADRPEGALTENLELLPIGP